MHTRRTDGRGGWRVTLRNGRRRLLLLIAIPTVTAVALGAVRLASSVQSALTYQRAEERAVLAADITVLAQHLEDERDQTVYYIASGINGGRGNQLNPKKLPANNQAAAQQYSGLKGFYR
jgi:hypothetical protein